MRTADIPDVAAIYAIHNRRTGMMYIGCSNFVRSRWYMHVSQLRQGKHPNRRLQAAWSAQGAAAFTVDILERHPWHYVRICPIERRHIAAHARDVYNVHLVPHGTQLRFDWYEDEHPELSSESGRGD